MIRVVLIIIVLWFGQALAGNTAGGLPIEPISAWDKIVWYFKGDMRVVYPDNFIKALKSHIEANAAKGCTNVWGPVEPPGYYSQARSCEPKPYQHGSVKSWSPLRPGGGFCCVERPQ